MVDTSDGSGDKLVYGVFTTPDNAIAGSAVCAFRMAAVRNTFENGQFKGQESANSNWLPVGENRMPEERPGSCSLDSKRLSERNLNFLKGHSLMDQAVSNMNREPLLVVTAWPRGERLTVIAVDAGVRTPDRRQTHDVLFVGTTKGKVIKFISARNAAGQVDSEKPVVIEEIQLFPYHVPVTNLQVLGHRLVALSDHEVKSLPLSRCSAVQVQSCGACVALQDPYCAWSPVRRACIDHREAEAEDASTMVQNVYTGRHAGCGNMDGKRTPHLTYHCQKCRGSCKLLSN